MTKRLSTKKCSYLEVQNLHIVAALLVLFIFLSVSIYLLKKNRLQVHCIGETELGINKIQNTNSTQTFEEAGNLCRLLAKFENPA